MKNIKPQIKAVHGGGTDTFTKPSFQHRPKMVHGLMINKGKNTGSINF